MLNSFRLILHIPLWVVGYGIGWLARPFVAGFSSGWMVLEQEYTNEYREAVARRIEAKQSTTQ